MFRWLMAIVVLAAAIGGAVYVVTGRSPAPSITIDKPDRVAGRKATLEVTVGAPGARLTSLVVSVEQDGRTTSLFSLETPESGSVTAVDADRLRVTRPFGTESVPALRSGAARIVVSASRSSFLDLHTLVGTATKDIQIDLEPPPVAVVSTHHYVNHGGSELVVYRTTPSVVSGVRVGDMEYQGYPASGAGLAAADPALHVAFFALLHDQDLKTPIAVFARDEAGNEATTPFVNNVFQKPFRRSRIVLDDRFLQRVVPEILAHSPELNMPAPSGDVLPAFLKINGDLRRLNADRIAEIVSGTSASRLWQGPFVQLGNSQVEAGFADHRTYVYGAKEVDRQVHLGFDLAATAGVPVAAANSGKVLHAAWLGIYGNCVIIDHGMGVASLYGHLSSIAVKVGDTVTKGQALGKSGMTGLAGGDHLHFTMLVNGRAVNPVEWWDPHWIQDRVDRKLGEPAGGSVAR
jgi:murein DD-endopeptidase MepM/ murein hydrolase activator NlpD